MKTIWRKMEKDEKMKWRKMMEKDEMEKEMKKEM